MISSSDFQLGYNEIYKQMRKYIWDFETIENLVDFELSVYKAIPSIEDVRKSFEVLRRDTRYVEVDDDELKSAFDEFSKLIEDDQEIYKKLYQVDEVIPS